MSSETPYMQVPNDNLQQLKGGLERLRSELSGFSGLMDPSRIGDERLRISRLIQEVGRNIAMIKRQPDVNRTQLGLLEGQYNEMQQTFKALCDKKKNLQPDVFSSRGGPSPPTLSEDPETRRQRLMQEDEDRRTREEEAKRKRQDDERKRQKQAQIDFTVSMVQDRTDQIRSLHEEVAAVNTATRDLAAMVAEDTEKLELLSMTAQHVEDNVSEGNKEVSQANKYQKSARTKLCCVLLLVLLLCGALIFIFVYFRCAIFGGCPKS